MRENHLEPYDQIFPNQEIDREFRHKTYTPILSQSGKNGYHDITVPNEDDMMRINEDTVYQEVCQNNYQDAEQYEINWSQKTKEWSRY